MKRIIRKVVSSLKSEQGPVVVKDGHVGLRDKLLAWWQGSELVLQDEEAAPKRRVKIRKGPDKGTVKSGKAGKSAARPEGKAASRGSGAGNGGAGNGGSGHGGGGAAGRNQRGAGAPSPSRPKSPPLPKAASLPPGALDKPGGKAAEEKSEIQNMDDGALMQHLWGSASRTPGGINGAVDIIEPIIRSLSPHKQVLDICAGDGRLLRYLQTYHQAATTGFDASQSLCERSNGNVTNFNPATANFGSEQFDFVCAAEGLQDLEEREAILKAAAEAMKVGGKMVLVDAITHSTTGHSPYMARHEGFHAPVLSARFYKKILADCGLKIIGSNNISKDYQTRMTGGWAKAAEMFRSRKMDADSKKLLNQQAEHHMSRIKTLQEGKAKMLRLELTK